MVNEKIDLSECSIRTSMGAGVWG